MATCVDTSIITGTSQLSREAKMSQHDDLAYKYVMFLSTSFSERVFCIPFSKTQSKTKQTSTFIDGFDREKGERDDPWLKMLEEEKYDVEQEPILSGYYCVSIVSEVTRESIGISTVDSRQLR